MGKPKETDWIPIRISRRNHGRIKKRGEYGETLDQILTRILDEADKGG